MHRASRSGRILTVLLTLAACLLAAVVIGRELRPERLPASSSPEPSPVFNEMWRDPSQSVRLVTSPVPIGESPRSDQFDFTDLTRAELLPDNRIVAFSTVGGKLMLLDERGRGIKHLVLQGAGPGEVRNPSNFSVANGDTLVIYDRWNARVTWLTPDNGVVRERAADGKAIPFPTHYTAGTLRDGRVVLYEAVGMAEFRPTDTVATGTLRIATLPVNASATLLATLPGAAYRVVETRYRGRRDRGLAPLVFSPRPHVAVWDTLIVTALSDRYKLDLRDGTARIIGSIGLDKPRRPVTAAMRNATIEQRLEWMRNNVGEEPIDPAESERLVRTLPFADSLPAFESIHVGRDGLLWVVDAIAVSDSGWAATAFRLDGSIAGRVTSAVTGYPMAFGRDRVVVRKIDNNGIVTLAIHQMIRESSPR